MCDSPRSIHAEALVARRCGRRCDFCTEPFFGGRSDRRYCSSLCSSRAYSLRRFGDRSKWDRRAHGIRLGSARKTKNCLHCGKSFQASLAGKYCSARCGDNFRYRASIGHRPNLTQEERTVRRRIFDKTCAVCGVSFTGLAHQKYCSLVCQRKRKGRVPQVVGHCVWCLSSFVKSLNRPKKYCSQKCVRAVLASNSKRPPIICLNCGVSFKLKGFKNQQRKYCSPFCRRIAYTQKNYYLQHPEESLLLLQGKLSEALGSRTCNLTPVLEDHEHEQPTN